MDAVAKSRSGTRARLIAVAARHFADYGFEGASQRAIQREVGVNPAAVHYHFGSKDVLYRAVVEAFLGPIQCERVEALAAIPDALEPAARLRRLVAAYVGPHIRLGLSDAGYDYARILARLQFEPNAETMRIVGDAVAEVRDAYLDQLATIFPAASRNRLMHGFTMAMALMAIAPIRGRDGGFREDQAERVTEQTAAYAAAGLMTLCAPEKPIS